MSHKPDQSSQLPPGQQRTEKWPIFSYAGTPQIALEQWRLTIFGAVEQPIVYTLEQVLDLPKTTVRADFHCVTGWSKTENIWEGVAPERLLEPATLKREAEHTLIHSFDGYSTNLPLAILLQNDTLFAYRHNGQELAPEHGAPLRLVVPKRYGWKSAKWVSGIELHDEETRGFWETRGYHKDGDPLREERFSQES